MNTSKSNPLAAIFKFAKEFIAIFIAVTSCLLSTATLYVNNLTAPNINIVTAPYIKHVVDNQSFNEAFFVPLTLINRGARPGTVLSFELTVTYAATGGQETYFGQYFTEPNSQQNIGPFFTPITLNGHSSQSQTVCFYPVGEDSGNFFDLPGAYSFAVTGTVANVRGGETETIASAFTVRVDEAMTAAMDAQPDGEYIFPLPIETAP